MNVFERYAEYYDLLYSKKDYAAEAAFALDKLEAIPGSGQSILELGCGTGRHAVEFLRHRFDVSGIDISSTMIQLAKARVETEISPAAAEQFDVDDIRGVEIGRTFDFVVSLFHVFSYQVTDDDLLAAFRTAARHLAPKGRLLIDFWYGPAVLADPPYLRRTTFQGRDFSVERIAEPKMHTDKNVVDVNYTLTFIGEGELETTEFKETHSMRYLFLEDIEDCLRKTGLRLRDSGCWLSDAPLSEGSWYGWITAVHN